MMRSKNGCIQPKFGRLRFLWRSSNFKTFLRKYVDYYGGTYVLQVSTHFCKRNEKNYVNFKRMKTYLSY